MLRRIGIGVVLVGMVASLPACVVVPAGPPVRGAVWIPGHYNGWQWVPGHWA